MAVKKESGDFFLQAESFWEKNQKTILVVLAVIVVGVGGWFAYQSMVVAPKEQQAAEAIFKAEAHFAQDSFQTALNGDASGKGFLYIINNYGSTKSGNLAKYYAGVSYLHLGDYNNAVKYLNDFSTDAKQIQMLGYGCLADAYGELNKNEEAIKYYKKAAETFPDDQVNAAEYLFRAAMKSELTGKTDDAVNLYKQIKEKFPQTQRGNEIDKYIYRLRIQPNDLSVK